MKGGEFLALALFMCMSIVCADIAVTPSDDLAGGIGVNIHVSYGGTSYDWTALSSSETQNLTTLLKSIGVRWVRDGGINFGAANQEKQWREITNLGIRATFIVGKYANITQHVQTYKTNYRGLVGMFEGMNEPELNPQNGGLPGAYQLLVDWSKALRSDPYWNNVSIASPSTGSTNFYTNKTAYPSSVQLSEWLNLHLYTNGNPTEVRATNYLNTFRPLVPGKPVIITEFGFVGSINNRNFGFSPQFTNGDPDCTHYIDGNGTGHPVVPRTDGLSSHAIYIIRSVLEYRRLNVSRMIVYEFFNQVPESGNPNATTDIAKYGYTDNEKHYGLVGTYRGTDGKLRLRPLPGFYAIKNLINWFNDKTGSGKAPPQWPLTFSSVLPANVRYLATSRKDGSLDVALWLSDPSCTLSTFHPANGDPRGNGTFWHDGDPEVEFAKYNRAVLGKELYPTPVQVTVQFNKTCKSFAINYPTRDSTIKTAAGANSYTLAVPVDPVLVRCNV